MVVYIGQMEKYFYVKIIWGWVLKNEELLVNLR